jgi:hypothetical protein
VKALILCQGSGARWDVDGKPFLGAPKHFVKVGGKPLVSHVATHCHARGIESTVIGPDERYRIEFSEWVRLDEPRPVGSDMAKLIATAHLWSLDEPTVLLFGDVWYSGECFDAIVGHDGVDTHFFRRPGPSVLTGHAHDETFAVWIPPLQAVHERLLTIATRLDHLEATHMLRNVKMRHVLAAVNGVGAERMNNGALVARLPHQTHIDDWTDDIDTPRDWVQFIGRFVAERLDVVVAVPYAPADVHRNSAYEWTVNWWERAMSVPVVTGRADTLNRSVMRNRAISMAFSYGPEVVFVADADTFVMPEQFWAAASLAKERDQLVLAFDNYVRFQRDETRRLMRWSQPNQFHPRLRSLRPESRRHASGAMAITKAVWEATGGYDERFTSWGFEDRCFWLAANVLCGEAPRVPGPALHLWHPPATDKDMKSAAYLEAERLARRVKVAAAYAPRAGIMGPTSLPAGAEANREELLAILAEPGGPRDRQSTPSP